MIVTFIHTIHGLKDQFDELLQAQLPQARRYHIADDSLIHRLMEAGGLTTPLVRRVCEHAVAAADAGSDYIQFTCSSISPCAEVASQLAGVPVLSIDEAMIRLATTRHRDIGVIATNPATLKPSVEGVEAMARHLGRQVRVTQTLCEGAYPALLAGDRATHDRIVMDHLQRLVDEVEGVCLAQASMARLADQVDQTKTPIYSSPRPAIERLRQLVQAEGLRVSSRSAGS
jgi:Asp/Glu/hydantoin racemase